MLALEKISGGMHVVICVVKNNDMSCKLECDVDLIIGPIVTTGKKELPN